MLKKYSTFISQSNEFGMINFPNAKINIGLHVTEKRKDGFHNIETVFFPIKLTDILEIQEYKRKEPHLSFSGLKIDAPPEQNLLYKAWSKIKSYYDIPGTRIHLHKIIPFGSGLGGGSSDAAHALQMLNQQFSLSIPKEKMHQFAEELGSDCPFFLENKPCFAYEKGNKIEPVSFNLKGLHLIIVVPEIKVSTKLAYQDVAIQKREVSNAFNDPNRGMEKSHSQRFRINSI